MQRLMSRRRPQLLVGPLRKRLSDPPAFFSKIEKIVPTEALVSMLDESSRGRC